MKWIFFREYTFFHHEISLLWFFFFTIDEKNLDTAPSCRCVSPLTLTQCPLVDRWVCRQNHRVDWSWKSLSGLSSDWEENGLDAETEPCVMFLSLRCNILASSKTNNTERRPDLYMSSTTGQHLSLLDSFVFYQQHTNVWVSQQSMHSPEDLQFSRRCTQRWSNRDNS